MEETIGTRINLNRVDEAIATGAQEVADKRQGKVGIPHLTVGGY